MAVVVFFRGFKHIYCVVSAEGKGKDKRGEMRSVSFHRYGASIWLPYVHICVLFVHVHVCVQVQVGKRYTA